MIHLLPYPAHLNMYHRINRVTLINPARKPSNYKYMVGILCHGLQLTMLQKAILCGVARYRTTSTLAMTM